MDNKKILIAKKRLNRWVLKWLLNIWSVITMGLFILDFFSGNRFDSTASTIGIIYIAILGIYVSEKEYIRWNNKFASKFIGEGFIIAWTILMVMFTVLAPLSEGKYIVPPEFAIVYTSIIGVFAITRQSKAMKYNKELRLLPKKK